MESTSGCSYTDGASYTECQVAAKGWPMPGQAGGKRSKARKCASCGKSHMGKSCKSRRSGSRKKKGGFFTTAIVPFGLFSLQKRTQRRTAHKSDRKHKSSRKSFKKSFKKSKRTKRR